MQSQLKGIRLSGELIEKIEAFGSKEGIDFSGSVKKLLWAALSQLESKTADQLPDFEKRRLNYEIKCWYMLQEIIARISGESGPEVLQNIHLKTKQHLEKYFFLGGGG